MFIFSGSFNWDSFAVDESITIVFPSTGFLMNIPVYIFFQWTKEPVTLLHSVAACFSSTISSITIDQSAITIGVNFGAKYSLSITVDVNYTTLSLTMRREGVPSTGTGTLIGVLANPAPTSVARFYTGTITWPPYAVNRMVTIVVPHGVVEGAFVGLFHKWTKCPVPLPSPNHSFVGTFTDVQIIGGITVASCLCAATGFKCTFAFQAHWKKGSFRLCVGEAPKPSGPSSDVSDTTELTSSEVDEAPELTSSEVKFSLKF